MTKELRLAYKFNFAYWTFVIFIAMVWTMSWINLGPSNRLLKTGWDQPLRRACASRVDICQSLEITENKGWFSAQHRVVVQSRLGQGDAALGLVNSQLSPEQRALVSINVSQPPLFPATPNAKPAVSKAKS